MKISVLGAGAWGTALAAAACQPGNAGHGGHDVLLWARSAEQAAGITSTRCNQRYLPGVALPAQLAVLADFDAALRHVQGVGDTRDTLLIVATPMAALRSTLQRLPASLPVLWLCKGFEADTGALGHEVAAAVRAVVDSGGASDGPAGAADATACGVLSGPSFAIEVARGQPTALVAASRNVALAQAAVAAFHGGALRVYTSDDVVGVEVGGAVKNVLAIAVGILDGMAAGGAPGSAPGLNARAALITRGLAEMTRLGVALGARAETFMGLSGLGDLVLTATGDLSRNRRVGLLLAAGHSLPDTLAQLGHVAEGVYSASTVLARAQALRVDMPITAAVTEVLAGRIAPAAALRQLMAREARSEV